LKEFYHVARKKISLSKDLELIESLKYLELPGYYLGEDFLKKKLELFPEGLSNFGEEYLHHYFDPDDKHLSNHHLFLIESVFEYVRRMKYPILTSRFQSLFASLTYEDAIKIKNKIFAEKGIIYKVSGADYFVGDMNWLNQSRGILGIEIVAEKYWSGSMSTDPIKEVLLRFPVKILEKL